MAGYKPGDEIIRVNDFSMYAILSDIPTPFKGVKFFHSFCWLMYVTTEEKRGDIFSLLFVRKFYWVYNLFILYPQISSTPCVLFQSNAKTICSKHEILEFSCFTHVKLLFHYSISFNLNRVSEHSSGQSEWGTFQHDCTFWLLSHKRVTGYFAFIGSMRWGTLQHNCIICWLCNLIMQILCAPTCHLNHQLV